MGSLNVYADIVTYLKLSPYFSRTYERNLQTCARVGTAISWAPLQHVFGLFQVLLRCIIYYRAVIISSRVEPMCLMVDGIGYRTSAEVFAA